MRARLYQDTALASDNPAYVNQAGLDHTGLTLIPISLRDVTPAFRRAECITAQLCEGQLRISRLMERMGWRSSMEFERGVL
jgi:hypothetical protein